MSHTILYCYGMQFIFRSLNCLMNLQRTLNCLFENNNTHKGKKSLIGVMATISTAKGSITCCTLSKINNITINTHLQHINDSQDVDTHNFGKPYPEYLELNGVRRI